MLGSHSEEKHSEGELVLAAPLASAWAHVWRLYLIVSGKTLPRPTHPETPSPERERERAF